MCVLGRTSAGNPYTTRPRLKNGPRGSRRAWEQFHYRVSGANWLMKPQIWVKWGRFDGVSASKLAPNLPQIFARAHTHIQFALEFVNELEARGAHAAPWHVAQKRTARHQGRRPANRRAQLGRTFTRARTAYSSTPHCALLWPYFELELALMRWLLDCRRRGYPQRQEDTLTAEPSTRSPPPKRPPLSALRVCRSEEELS